jgi:hypothetical protein
MEDRSMKLPSDEDYVGVQRDKRHDKRPERSQPSVQPQWLLSEIGQLIDDFVGEQVDKWL